MCDISPDKYSKIIQKGSKYTVYEINNTIDQCESFLNIIHNYLQRCLDNLVRISIPTLDSYDYISACNEIRLYVREIDNIVQSSQYNTRQILASSKNSESSKEILFNILPFGYTFVFEVPVVDSVKLGIDQYKIDWNSKHSCITALVATLPKNINRTDQIKLINTYDFSNVEIGTTGSVYSNYGIDKGNVTAAILKLPSTFEFNNSNYIDLITMKREILTDDNEITCPSNLVTGPDNTVICPEKVKYTEDVYSKHFISHNNVYLTYIAEKTRSQVDFSSNDLLTYTFPFDIKKTDKDREDFINLNLHKFKSQFNKALNLVEIELEKMIHYKSILVPMQTRVLNIHQEGNRRYVKNKCDPNQIRVNRYNRKHYNKKIYATREVTEFEPNFISIYEASKGNLTNTSIIDDNFGIELEELNNENRKQTYNKNNTIELFKADCSSFAKYEYDSSVYENPKFTLIS